MIIAAVFAVLTVCVIGLAINANENKTRAEAENSPLVDGIIRSLETEPEQWSRWPQVWCLRDLSAYHKNGTHVTAWEYYDQEPFVSIRGMSLNDGNFELSKSDKRRLYEAIVRFCVTRPTDEEIERKRRKTVEAQSREAAIKHFRDMA